MQPIKERKGYQFHDPNGIYFTTTAVVQWVDVFTRPVYANIVLDSLVFCQENKGLVLHAWCLMSNHLHLIVSKEGAHDFPAIFRDFKKFTGKQIIAAIKKEPTESRKDWMLWLFRTAAKRNSNNRKYQFWQQDNHPIELATNKFIDQKLNYLHQNPVKAGLVQRPFDYNYSSAPNYAGEKGLLDIEPLY